MSTSPPSESLRNLAGALRGQDVSQMVIERDGDIVRAIGLETSASVNLATGEIVMKVHSNMKGGE